MGSPDHQCAEAFLLMEAIGTAFFDRVRDRGVFTRLPKSWKYLSASGRRPDSIFLYPVINRSPNGVNTAPPPPRPPALARATGSSKLVFRSARSSHARR